MVSFEVHTALLVINSQAYTHFENLTPRTAVQSAASKCRNQLIKSISLR